jgi:hypothetical protein
LIYNPPLRIPIEFAGTGTTKNHMLILKTEKTERFFYKTEKPYNDNVNDNDNDNVIDNGSGNGNGNGNGNENEEGFASTTTRIEKEFYFFYK